MTPERRSNEKRFQESSLVQEVADALETALRSASSAMVSGRLSSSEFMIHVDAVKRAADSLAKAVNDMKKAVTG